MGADRAAAAVLARAGSWSRPVPDGLFLPGILYVLHNDIAWQLLLLKLGPARGGPVGGGWGGGRRVSVSHHRAPVTEAP
ncbi:hypothetical protein [Streptomyces europaeiscabiei]|uniref:hypothetical protein n=1 Tax=Streptomyces europaeiscabiei TaxID=146819 RepID=UPI000A50AF3C|nr:hypothetical protein [Streptomyces europaeiscabiei]